MVDSGLKDRNFFQFTASQRPILGRLAPFVVQLKERAANLTDQADYNMKPHSSRIHSFRTSEIRLLSD